MYRHSNAKVNDMNMELVCKCESIAVFSVWMKKILNKHDIPTWTWNAQVDF